MSKSSQINPNIVWQTTHVERADRENLLQQRGRIIWFTGLSGSGKSTVAVEVERQLLAQGRATYLLDGDNLRFGLNKDLTFSDEDRRENIRRIAEVAKLFVDAGIIVLAAFISPFRADRDAIRASVEPGQFVEIAITTPLAVCEERDVKGLYAKARAGEIPNFTGISSPYEPPLSPELALNTTDMELNDAAQQVIDVVEASMDVGFRRKS